MNIPLDVEVHCTDGTGGHSLALVLNPVTQVATHLVVKNKGHDHAGHLLPLQLITGATAKSIAVSCTRDELGRLDPFEKMVRSEETGLGGVSAQALAGAELHSGLGFQDFGTIEGSEPAYIEVEAIPEADLAVRHGIPVEATDGTVGKVDEFALNPQTGKITFLVLKEGHLLKHDVPVPVDQVDRFGEEAVFLKLTKVAVEQLPHE